MTEPGWKQTKIIKTFPQWFNEKFATLEICIQSITEVGFASFLPGGFITAIVVNPPERKLAKRTSVYYLEKKIMFQNDQLYIKVGPKPPK